MTMDQAKMNAWAVAIADESMFAMLESECISEGERPEGLQPTNEGCAAVARLADASFAVREAFAWLKAERDERQRREAAEREWQEEQAKERERAVEELGEIAPRRSGPPGWERPNSGPSPVAIGAMLAALFAAYIYLNRGSTSAVPRPTAVQPPRVHIPNANPTPDDRYFNPPMSAPSNTVVAPPLVSEQREGFPPGGSAYYFGGRAEGSAAANVLRLYAPPTSTSRFAVLVVRVPSDQVYAQAYLESNDVVDLAMPEGMFRLAYASGNEWFGKNQMFGPSRPARAYGRGFHVGRGDAMVRVELPVE